MFATVAAYAFVYSFFAPGIILGHKAGLHRTALSLWTVLLWISLEIVLSDIFLPIPSLSLGYHLWPLTSVIQLSDITGVFGLSFWVISINVLLFNLLHYGVKNNCAFLSLILIFTFFIFGYGFKKTHSISDSSSNQFSINIIYTSILSGDKKNKHLREKIFEILKQETIESIKSSEKHPNLILWPETSVPVALRSVHDKIFIMDLLAIAQKNNVPILVGALSIERNVDKSVQKYNSAFLIPEQGFVSQEYRKNILVPFTEKNIFKAQTKESADILKPIFNAGTAPGLISLFDKVKFGVVICYEIFFPDYVRKYGNKGSQFLVNITNDYPAFENLKTAYKIPLPHLVFRAVENKKFLVRCANWGYSMVISPKGRIIESSSIGSSGYLNTTISRNYSETFFSKHGFLLAKILFLFTCIWAVALCIRIYKLNNQQADRN